MNDGIAISVKNVSKSFHTIQSNRALKDVSFQLKEGDVLGLLGENGAGKSTLLKIISGLTKPDYGTIEYNGRLSYILDIGSCFHPDLSGRDNVFMAGGINGFSKEQITKEYDSIVEFSELQNFMDVPLKYYSSGMYLRLAFSTNTTFYSDILLLDEVLGVGDAHFQQKAQSRIRDIVTNGTTVIMTGHNLEELSSLCTHGLWLSSGKQSYFGTINETIDKYLTHNAQNRSNTALSINSSEEKSAIMDPSSGSAIKRDLYIDNDLLPYNQYIQFSPSENKDLELVTLMEVGIKSVGGNFSDELCMDDQLEIMIHYQKNIDQPLVLFAVIQDKFGHNLMSICSYRLLDSSKYIDNTDKGKYVQTVKLPARLFNLGVFSLSIFFTDQYDTDIATYRRVLFFRVEKSEFKFGIFSYNGNFSGSLFPVFDWETHKEN